MSDFQVGRKVKVVAEVFPEMRFLIGSIGTIVEKGRYGWWVKLEGKIKLRNGDYNLNGNERCFYESELQLLPDEPLSEYEQISRDIDALDNGWDKRADDILERIMRGCKKSRSYNIEIHQHIFPSYIQSWSGNLYKEIGSGWSDKFYYSTQCEKMDAFKKALRHLLDGSDIPKIDYSQKIAELEKQRDEIDEKIEELERGVR